MSATFRLSPLAEGRPFYLAVIAGLACAFVIGKALPSTMDAISAVIEPLCASSAPAGSTQDVVEPISSHALPNVPGKRVTIVRVFYGPGGFTRAHRHAGSVTAYVTKGEIRSQLGRRSGRNLQGRPVVLRAARRRAPGLGQRQQHRACGTDRGVRGGRGRAVDDVRGLVNSSCAGLTRASITIRSTMDRRVKPAVTPHTGFSTTRNPSRGFGIGHICQSGL